MVHRSRAIHALYEAENMVPDMVGASVVRKLGPFKRKVPKRTRNLRECTNAVVKSGQTFRIQPSGTEKLAGGSPFVPSRTSLDPSNYPTIQQPSHHLPPQLPQCAPVESCAPPLPPLRHHSGATAAPAAARHHCRAPSLPGDHSTSSISRSCISRAARTREPAAVLTCRMHVHAFLQPCHTCRSHVLATAQP